MFIDDICQLVRTALEASFNESNQFNMGATFPVTRIRGAIEIKVFPDQSLPEPIMVKVDLRYGTSLETALDRVRESHGLEVLVAKRTKSGLIVNAPVEDNDGKD